MKNAIEAEKAKSAKIENDLKLEIEKLKAELEVEKETVANMKLKAKIPYFSIDINLITRSGAKSIKIIDLKAKLEAEKAKSAKIENDLKLEIEKLKAELNAAYATLMKLKVGSQEIIISNLKSKLKDKEAVIEKLELELETRTAISSFSTSSSVIDEDEELDELKFELELEKASNARLVSALKTMPAPAKYDEITARWEEQVIINQDLKFALQKQYRDIYNLKAELKVTKDIETKFEYMKTKFDNEKKYNSELNDVIERLYAIINNRKFED